MGTLEWLALLLGSGAVVGCFVQAGRAFWTTRMVGASGPTPMIELSEGLHEIRGTSLAEGGVTAPLSGRACMYSRVVVEQLVRTRWQTVIERREAVPVWVDDGTGRVWVDPSAAEVVISGASRVRTGIYTHPSGEWSEVATRLGELAATPSQPFLRWREECLDAGDVVTVVGTARREAGGGWAMAAAAGSAFVVSDRDDGEVVRHHRRLGRRWALGGVAALIGSGLVGYVLVTR